MGCSDSGCVTDTMAKADAWMKVYPVGSGITGDSAAWKEAEPLYLALDNYDNGKSCGGSGSCTDPPPPSSPTCGQCSGGVTKLILMYKGTSTATVEIKDSNNQLLYKAAAAPISSFTVTGKASNGTFGQYIKIYVNGYYKATFYTDCSKSIYPGMAVGSFTVGEGYSLNGGKFCRVSTSSCTSDDDSRYSRDYCDSHRGESSCSDFFDFKRTDSYDSRRD